MAGHHVQPKCQSLPHEIRVKKLQRGIQKYALHRLDSEDFEVRGMEEAQLSPDRLELYLACAWSRVQRVSSFDHRLMEQWW
jgi:hypothetical protein